MSTSPNTTPWGSGLAAAGLRPRYRDLFRVAYVSTMSNGLIARNLGCAGRLLVPVSGGVQLMMVTAARPITARRNGAICQVLPPDGKWRADPAAAVAFVLVIAAYSVALAVVAVVVPAWVFGPLVVLLGLVMLADTSAGVLLSRIRQRKHDVPKMSAATVPIAAVAIAAVAAYPRDQRRGRELMKAVHAVLDEAGVLAVLDARPQHERSASAERPRWWMRRRREPDLLLFYAALGYRRTEVWRRMMRRPGDEGPAGARRDVDEC